MFDIAGRQVGGDAPCYIVAEVGINHNGSLDLARQLIEVAFRAGCDAVKFQKRDVDLVYTPEELARPRESPFGTTSGDLRRGLELDASDYTHLAAYAAQRRLAFFASAWDVNSLGFLEQRGVPCHKVPSAMLTNHELLTAMVRTGKPLIISTGMSTRAEIDAALQWRDDDLGHLSDEYALLACTSAYPAAIDDLHLARIDTLRAAFPYAVIGYSGHEVGVWSTLSAVAMGARIVERHITLDRSLWGSDQAASLEPGALTKLVQEIRDFERAYGSGELRCLPCEEPIKAKLRRAA